MRQVIDASVRLAWLLAHVGRDAMEADDGPSSRSTFGVAQVLDLDLDIRLIR